MATGELKLIGKEVACSSFGPLFEDLARQGVSREEIAALAEGTGRTIKELSDRRERIGWDGYCRLMENVRKYWGDQEFVEHGLRFFSSPLVRPIVLVARQFYNAEDFYRFSTRRVSRLHFTCIETTVHEVEPGHLRFTISMESGYSPNREYCLITAGCLTALPGVVDLPHARVEMGEIAKTVHYDIKIQQSRAPLRRLRRFLTWPFAAKALAEELQEVNELLHRRYAQLESEVHDRKKMEEERELLIEELQSKNEQLEQFTYTVSHDLKSPLVTILGILGFLKKDIARADAERIERDLLLIENSASTLKSLLEDLLELSRVGRVTGTFGRVVLEELAHEVVRLLDGRIRQTGVRVTVLPGLPVVQGDSQRLLQVLLNLVDNAVKFAGDDQTGEVEIGARVEDGEKIIYVRDDGQGLASEDLERIFGLFKQLDAGKEGTGIGLTLVRRIVEHHGGKIWAESEGSGKGCVFCFTLPGIRTIV